MEATVAEHGRSGVRWTFAQKGIVVLAVLQLAWSVAGLVAESSFAVGAEAPTERVLGVDFNGYHALSGFLLFLPAFFFALRPRWAVLYAIAAAAGLISTGVWALFDTDPLWVFTFPHNSADGVFHIATGSLFAAVAAIQLGLDRSTRS